MIKQPKQEHHRMLLVDNQHDNADEFYCPTCGRRILIQWPPDYQKIVLDPGDESASHSGGKGGLEVSLPQLAQTSEMSQQNSDVQLSIQDKACLNNWAQWLDQMGFENLWSGDS